MFLTKTNKNYEKIRKYALLTASNFRIEGFATSFWTQHNLNAFFPFYCHGNTTPTVLIFQFGFNISKSSDFTHLHYTLKWCSSSPCFWSFLRINISSLFYRYHRRTEKRKIKFISSSTSSTVFFSSSSIVWLLRTCISDTNPRSTRIQIRIESRRPIQYRW